MKQMNTFVILNDDQIDEYIKQLTESIIRNEYNETEMKLKPKEIPSYLESLKDQLISLITSMKEKPLSSLDNKKLAGTEFLHTSFELLETQVKSNFKKFKLDLEEILNKKPLSCTDCKIDISFDDTKEFKSSNVKDFLRNKNFKYKSIPYPPFKSKKIIRNTTIKLKEKFKIQKEDENKIFRTKNVRISKANVTNKDLALKWKNMYFRLFLIDDVFFNIEEYIDKTRRQIATIFLDYKLFFTNKGTKKIGNEIYKLGIETIDQKPIDEKTIKLIRRNIDEQYTDAIKLFDAMKEEDQKKIQKIINKYKSKQEGGGFLADGFNFMKKVIKSIFITIFEGVKSLVLFSLGAITYAAALASAAVYYMCISLVVFVVGLGYCFFPLTIDLIFMSCEIFPPFAVAIWLVLIEGKNLMKSSVKNVMEISNKINGIISKNTDLAKQILIIIQLNGGNLDNHNNILEIINLINNNNESIDSTKFNTLKRGLKKIDKGNLKDKKFSETISSNLNLLYDLIRKINVLSENKTNFLSEIKLLLPSSDNDSKTKLENFVKGIKIKEFIEISGKIKLEVEARFGYTIDFILGDENDRIRILNELKSRIPQSPAQSQAPPKAPASKAPASKAPPPKTPAPLKQTLPKAQQQVPPPPAPAPPAPPASQQQASPPALPAAQQQPQALSSQQPLLPPQVPQASQQPLPPPSSLPPQTRQQPAPSLPPASPKASQTQQPAPSLPPASPTSPAQAPPSLPSLPSPPPAQQQLQKQPTFTEGQVKIISKNKSPTSLNAISIIQSNNGTKKVTINEKNYTVQLEPKSEKNNSVITHVNSQKFKVSPLLNDSPLNTNNIEIEVKGKPYKVSPIPNGGAKPKKYILLLNTKQVRLLKSNKAGEKYITINNSQVPLKSIKNKYKYVH
jgi:hypothetical protein